MRAALIFILLLDVTPCLAVEAADVDKTVRAACDCIEGIRFGDVGDKSTWSIQFKVDATDDQKKAAQAAIDAFDVNAPVAQPKTLEERVQELEAAKDALVAKGTITEQDIQAEVPLEAAPASPAQ